MKIFVATKNSHKLSELERILIPMGFEVISERDLDTEFSDVEETGTTFKENALIKASAGCKNTGLITVADDSGLCVDALSGAPGVYSARYSGVHGNDEENIKKLLFNLKDVKKPDRTARFVSAVACVFPSGKNFVVEGTCEGYILDEKCGTNGFGYDPVFCSKLGPVGLLTATQKDSISHRGIALKLFKAELENFMKQEENIC